MRLRGFLSQHLVADAVQQQARSHVAISRILLDQGARGQDRASADFVHGDAVVEILDHILQNQFGVDRAPQSLTGFLQHLPQPLHVQRPRSSIFGHVERL